MGTEVKINVLKKILNSAEFKKAYSKNSEQTIEEVILHLKHGYSVDGVCIGLQEIVINGNKELA